MMKSLFMVWYLSGSPAIVGGPLPYDLEECEIRAAEILSEILKKNKDAEFLGLELKCEYHVERPNLED